MRLGTVLSWTGRLLATAVWIASALGLISSGAGMKWLIDLEVWLTNKVPDPILFAFLTGLMIAIWIVPVVWKAFHHRVLGKENTRTLLAQLRNRGVGIRNEPTVNALTPEEWMAWGAKTVAWNAEVIATIKKVNEADAEWFSVMDIMQPPRVGFLVREGVDPAGVVKAFQLHDERLKRLDQLITGEKGNICP